jgi:DNA-binding beta-propeller fold protein YncE
MLPGHRQCRIESANYKRVTRNRKTSFSIFLLMLALASMGCRSPIAETATYRFVKSWGKPGGGPGEFTGPIGIAIAGDEMFVADAVTARILVFDRDGNFLREFGQSGTEEGELARPMHIAAWAEQLYAADFANNRIQVFSLGGESITTIGEEGTEPGQFGTPSGIAIDDQGRLYVADFGNHRIQLLDNKGVPIRQLGTGDAGVGPEEFSNPTDIALRPGGGFVVCDYDNHRIQAFGPDWTPEWMVPQHTTEPGSLPGEFRAPTAVLVDAEGYVFVADHGNDRIQKFAPDGTFVLSFGELGIEPGQLYRPISLAIDEEGNLLVVEFNNKRVQLFELVP